nr:protein glc8 [Quercus suber]
MATVSPLSHSPGDATNKRPRGILKNSQSYQHIPADAQPSPAHERPSFNARDSSNAVSLEHGNKSSGPARPEMPGREMSEKEIVQYNTELNAGGRRNSSAPRGSVSRRQSATSNGESADGSNARLKWDEANLYLNEGQMGGKMKIDEPKTPYAKQYDPMDDEDEVAAINASEVAVDELELERKPARRTRESDIPGLDLGEPQLEPLEPRDSDGEKSVKVDSDAMDVDGGRHGEDEEQMAPEELEKHRKFEEMRKKHYEMKNIKSLLGHSDEFDVGEDEDETTDDGRGR